MVKAVSTIALAIEEAKKLIPQYPNEIFIAGGGEVYTQSLPYLNRIYLTMIDTAIEGDSHFPELPEKTWKLTSERKVEGQPSYAFQIWEPR